MGYPHVIRLAGPWQCEPLSGSELDAQGVSQDVVPSAPLSDSVRRASTWPPRDWREFPGVSYRGAVRYLRRFHKPRTLSSHERLWLVCEGADAFGYLWLNGARLGPINGYAVPAAFDISRIVAPANEIRLDVYLPAGRPFRPGRENLPGGLIGATRLEVRSRVSIERLVLRLAGDTPRRHLELSGEIVGDLRGPPPTVVVGHERGEVFCGGAPCGGPFSISAPIAELDGFPSFRPGFRVAPFPVAEVELHDGQLLAWNGLVPIVTLNSTFESSTQRLRIGEDELHPPGRVIRDIESLPEVIAGHQDPKSAPPVPWVLERVATDAEYDSLESLGIPLIQALPRAWLHSVGPRLAQRPTIVAWTDIADLSLGELAQVEPRPPAFGRAWLGRRVAVTTLDH